MMEPTSGRDAGVAVPGEGRRRARAWWTKKRVIIPGVMLFIAGVGGVAAQVGAPAPRAPGAAAPSQGATPAPAVIDWGSSSSASAAPTFDPSPTSTPENYAGDYAAAFGDFSAVTKSGRGDSVVTLPTDATALIVTATHAGDANFIVSGLDKSNQLTASVINEIGTYRGTVMLNRVEGDAVKLKVKASGKWTMRFAPVSQAPLWASEQSGRGDGVYLYEKPAGDWQFTHRGESNFIVRSIGGSDGGLINEIGAYSGTVPMSRGPAVITVKADGAWTATSRS